VQPNKAITGRNAFAHEAGIHQDGILKNPLTYEIMTPQSVGVPDSRLVLGKHSGRHALALRCEQLGHPFERRELDEVYRKFVVLADRIKKVQDCHLLELIEEVKAAGKRIPSVGAGLPFTRAASAGGGTNEPRSLSFAASARGTAAPGASVSFAEHQRGE
jgi:isopropylmalate/homocitrate/citramalate synthase